MNRKALWVVAFLLVLGSAVFISCSGGGGSSSFGFKKKPTQLSGSVAAGAPMIAMVWLKDSTGTTVGPVQTASDGSYAFNIKSLTPPFYLKAEGAVTNTSYTLYSVAMAGGTTNVNPLTSVIAAAAAGATDPAAGFNSPTTTTITQEGITSATTAITTILQPVLTSYGASGDPLTSAYATDHSGLDAVMDVVSTGVNTTTGLMTMTNTMSNETIAQATTVNLANPTVTVSAYPPFATMGDIQGIQAMFTQLMVALNTGSTGTIATASLDPFFASDASFVLYDGLDRAGTITQWAADFSNWAKTYSKMIISVGPGADSLHYTVQTMSYFTDGSYYNLWPAGLVVVKEGASWKLTDNGHESTSRISVESHRWVSAIGSEVIKSGIDFYMPIFGTHPELQKAHVSGPGLPDSGLDMTRILRTDGGPDWFGFDSNPTFTVVGTRAEFCPMTDYLTDAAIAAIPDNSVYTITFTDGLVSTPVDTRYVKIPKRPFTKAEAMSPDIYATVPGLTHAIADAHIPGTFTFTYTKPTAFVTIWMTTALETGVMGNGSGDFQAPLNVNTVPLTTTGTSTDAWLMLNTTDQYRRSPYLWWEFK